MIVWTLPRMASAQTLTSPASHLDQRNSIVSICNNLTIEPAALQALRLVCDRASTSPPMQSASVPLIVVGFVGGFAKPDDLRHPEPLFALYLQQQYGAEIHAQVFSNHDARHARLYVLRHLDTDRDGVVSLEERRKARVIIYGHSWGASETAAFAAQLERLQIPVLLTVQVDIISKPGQEPDVIPPNVAEAINFYQSGGPLHGRPQILAADPAKTAILGNIQLLYDHLPVNCDNYNWFVRRFNKPHHEIENDPRVWSQVSSLIDAEATSRKRPLGLQETTTASAMQTSRPSQ